MRPAVSPREAGPPPPCTSQTAGAPPAGQRAAPAGRVPFAASGPWRPRGTGAVAAGSVSGASRSPGGAVDAERRGAGGKALDK